jgi:hypothetical protein
MWHGVIILLINCVSFESLRKKMSAFIVTTPHELFNEM